MMLKKVACLLTALTIVAGCTPSEKTEDTPTYTLTGEMMDPDASLPRLLTDMHVTATDLANGKVYAGSVGSEDAKTCRYVSWAVLPTRQAIHSRIFPFIATARTRSS